MKKLFTLTFSVFFLVNFLIAQTPSHRLLFKYRISHKKISQLKLKGVRLVDAKDSSLNLCKDLKVLKCLVTNKDGILTIDPWKISDSRIDANTNLVDPCFGKTDTVNAATLFPLKIDIQRGSTRKKGTPILIGHPTMKVTLPYQTWLIGVNTLSVKFRPRVTDYNGKIYSVNAITGTINAGLTIGYSFGWTSFTHRSTNSLSLTPAFSIGMTSASLSKEPLRRQVVTTYNPNNFILSPSLGLILARNDLGIFFTYGSDIMMGENSNAWAYQYKGFFGIGISASFKL